MIIIQIIQTHVEIMTHQLLWLQTLAVHVGEPLKYLPICQLVKMILLSQIHMETLVSITLAIQILAVITIRRRLSHQMHAVLVEEPLKQWLNLQSYQLAKMTYQFQILMETHVTITQAIQAPVEITIHLPSLPPSPAVLAKAV